MSWLRERAESGARAMAYVEPGDQPWRPAVLDGLSEEVAARLTYAVLDERDAEEGGVSLVLTPWPRLDALGRVRHPRVEPDEIGVPVVAWVALLHERRVPDVLRTRPPRVGDAFAMLLRRKRDVLHPVGPVVDVTADARDAARAAFYGAVATPLDPGAAEEIRDDESDADERLSEPAEWTAHVSSRKKAKR